MLDECICSLCSSSNNSNKIIVIVIVAQFSFVVLEVIEQLSKALFKRDTFLC